MIALVKHRDGRMGIAERRYIGSLTLWVTDNGTMWLMSWVKVLKELDTITLDGARLVYPEYFI